MGKILTITVGELLMHVRTLTQLFSPLISPLSPLFLLRFLLQFISLPLSLFGRGVVVVVVCCGVWKTFFCPCDPIPCLDERFICPCFHPSFVHILLSAFFVVLTSGTCGTEVYLDIRSNRIRCYLLSFFLVVSVHT